MLLLAKNNEKRRKKRKYPSKCKRDWKELAASLSWIVQSPENRIEQNRLTYKLTLSLSLTLSLKQFL